MRRDPIPIQGRGRLDKVTGHRRRWGGTKCDRGRIGNGGDGSGRNVCDRLNHQWIRCTKERPVRRLNNHPLARIDPTLD